MYLEVLSLEPDTKLGRFTIVAVIDGHRQIFSATVHAGEVRYFTFDGELQDIIQRNPLELKPLIKLISTVYDGGSVELPLRFVDLT